MADLFVAPPGAAEAECAVCGDSTLTRIVQGDGHVPICSVFCDHAWPRVSKLYEALKRIPALGHNDDCMFCGFKDSAARTALLASNTGGSDG